MDHDEFLKPEEIHNEGDQILFNGQKCFIEYVDRSVKPLETSKIYRLSIRDEHSHPIWISSYDQIMYLINYIMAQQE